MNAKCQYWPASVDLFIIFRGQASSVAPVLVYRPEISSSSFARYRPDRRHRNIAVFHPCLAATFPSAQSILTDSHRFSSSILTDSRVETRDRSNGRKGQRASSRLFLQGFIRGWSISDRFTGYAESMAESIVAAHVDGGCHRIERQGLTRYRVFYKYRLIDLAVKNSRGRRIASRFRNRTGPLVCRLASVNGSELDNDAPRRSQNTRTVRKSNVGRGMRDAANASVRDSDAFGYYSTPCKPITYSR